MIEGGAISWLGATEPSPRLFTQRLSMRPPERSDHLEWAELRGASRAHLTPWEPTWSSDHLSASAFRRRVAWSRGEINAGRAYPMLIFRLDDRSLVGGVTLEHVRRGAAMSAALGYWLGEDHVGNGYMSEALRAVLSFAHFDLDLSRVEAACLPENAASRRVLRRCGFREERVARAFLQIDGRWRDHLIFERRRADRADEGDA